MIQFLNVLQYLVLALWVGSLFSFGVLFAPVLFAALPTREQAGSIAGSVLARIDTLGLITGGIMLVVTALQAIDSGWQSIDLGRLLTAVLMLALVIVSATTVRQKLNAVKEKMKRPIDEYAQDDPLRQEYNQQHRLSRLLFSTNMLLGILLIVLSALR
ncbi:MAG: DUF4149 domain-containing protein [Bacillota bacterium]